MLKREVCWWLSELRRRGWGTRVLGRAMRRGNPAHDLGKASGKQRIPPTKTKQIRMSYVLTC